MIATDDQNSKICVHSGFAGHLLHFRGFTVAFQGRFILGLQVYYEAKVAMDRETHGSLFVIDGIHRRYLQQ